MRITTTNQTIQLHSRLSLAIFILAATSSSAFSQAAKIEYVVPQFLQSIEGNVENVGGNTFPNGWRIQFIYAASEFDELPESHHVITEMRWRPDASVISPVTSTDLFEIRLSTTQKSPNTISAVYEENIDNPQTLVVSGEVTRSTTASGPVGGPRVFDMVFGFQTPFLYNPAEGNLLVDIISLGPTAETDWYLSPDLHNGTNGLAGGVGDPNGYTNPVAPNVFRNQITPTMFVFVPEPSGAALLSLGLLILCRAARTRNQ